MINQQNVKNKNLDLGCGSLLYYSKVQSRVYNEQSLQQVVQPLEPGP